MTLKTEKEKSKRIVEDAEHPVSINQIADKLGISWVTARGLLLSLAVKGKISAVKTGKSWIFFQKDSQEFSKG